MRLPIVQTLIEQAVQFLLVELGMDKLYLVRSSAHADLYSFYPDAKPPHDDKDMLMIISRHSSAWNMPPSQLYNLRTSPVSELHARFLDYYIGQIFKAEEKYSLEFEEALKHYDRSKSSYEYAHKTRTQGNGSISRYYFEAAEFDKAKTRLAEARNNFYTLKDLFEDLLSESNFSTDMLRSVFVPAIETGNTPRYHKIPEKKSGVYTLVSEYPKAEDAKIDLSDIKDWCQIPF